MKVEELIKKYKKKENLIISAIEYCFIDKIYDLEMDKVLNKKLPVSDFWAKQDESMQKYVYDWYLNEAKESIDTLNVSTSILNYISSLEMPEETIKQIETYIRSVNNEEKRHNDNSI